LISVHAETAEETSRAKEIFQRHGAEDIAAAGEEAVGNTSTSKEGNKYRR
jgi:hypothetical protein